MAGNPNPQHNPTDGLGVAAYVTMLGSPALTKVGSQQTLSPGNRVGGTQYALTLSLTGAPSNTCQLAVLVVDVKGNTYSANNVPVYKSYGDAKNAAGSPPAWYHTSNGTSGGITGNTSYDANVASVSSSGLITARAVGQCIVEVQFPTFDNVQTPETDANTGNPKDMIYSQIIVTVVA
jgi:hypothetical protein